MGGKEILTLQFGHYSNYIGTHWWNIQELGFEYGGSSVVEINHEVLFREGITEKKEITFTPRLLLVDLKGSLKSLPEKGTLYNQNLNTTVEWEPTAIEVKKDPASDKIEFQKDLENFKSDQCIKNKLYDLKKDVSVWSDFLYTRFHPRTVNIINKYQHCNENAQFNVFPLGVTLWNSPQFEEDFCDKIRNYIEECDNFQGFHVLNDCNNAFSGLTSSCIQYLRDEYATKSLLLFPVMPTDKLCDGVVNQSLNDSVRILNIILGFGAFNEYSSLFIPLSTENKGWRQPTFRKFDLLDYEHDLPYHSSAILASALDTFTLKYRLKETNFSIADLCTDLNRYERRAAAASLHLPFPFDDDSTLLECLDNWQGPLSQSITPNCEIGSKNLMQYITLRGIKEEKLKQPPHLAKKQINLPAYACDTITEMLNLYLAYSTEYSASNVTVVCKPLNTQTPFPQMVKKYSPGNTINKQTKNIGTDIPVLAGLHNGSFVGDMLESLLTEAKRIKLGKMHPFTTEGLESDEIHECLNSLHTLRENYTEDCFL